jgi:hypothetical protein
LRTRPEGRGLRFGTNLLPSKANKLINRRHELKTPLILLTLKKQRIYHNPKAGNKNISKRKIFVKPPAYLEWKKNDFFLPGEAIPKL